MSMRPPSHLETGRKLREIGRRHSSKTAGIQAQSVCCRGISMVPHFSRISRRWRGISQHSRDTSRVGMVPSPALLSMLPRRCVFVNAPAAGTAGSKCAPFEMFSWSPQKAVKFSVTAVPGALLFSKPALCGTFEKCWHETTKILGRGPGFEGQRAMVSARTVEPWPRRKLHEASSGSGLRSGVRHTAEQEPRSKSKCIQGHRVHSERMDLWRNQRSATFGDFRVASGFFLQALAASASLAQQPGPGVRSPELGLGPGMLPGAEAVPWRELLKSLRTHVPGWQAEMRERTKQIHNTSPRLSYEFANPFPDHRSAIAHGSYSIQTFLNRYALKTSF